MSSRSLSLTARFADHFERGFKKPLKESVVTIVVIIATYGFRYIRGRSSFDAWRQDFWEEAFPLILILLIVASWHVIRAAYSLLKEIQRESLRPVKRYPSIHLPLGHDTPVAALLVPSIPFYKAKIIFITIGAIAMICMLGFASYELANQQPNRSSSAANAASTPTPSPTSSQTPSPATPSPTVALSPKRRSAKRITKEPCSAEDRLLGLC
jgi:hypothetical protein